MKSLNWGYLFLALVACASGLAGLVFSSFPLFFGFLTLCVILMLDEDRGTP